MYLPPTYWHLVCASYPKPYLMSEKAVKKSLEELLKGSHAHVSFEDAVKGLPEKLRGVIPENMPYSIWQLVEHIRIAQNDILEFSRNPGHQSPPWPEGYWPKDPAPKDDAAWKHSLSEIKKDLAEFIKLLDQPDTDLYEPFPHGDGQHLFREALLIADHTSYHTGEIVTIRRLLGAWH